MFCDRMDVEKPKSFSTSILSQNIKKLKRESFYYRKKISQCRKNWKGGPFGIFQHPFWRKTAQNWRGDPLGKNFFFEKKSHSAEKIEKGDPLGFSNIHFDAKQQKKWRGTFGEKNFLKKVSQCRKKLKGGGTLWSRPVWYVTRKNRKNFFGSVR